MFDEQMVKLAAVDALKEVPIRGSRCMIHRDHRWTLVILQWAQQNGLAPSPCNLVLFDAHHDSLEPDCIERLDRCLKSGLTPEELFDICSGMRDKTDKERLRKLDDDWIQAGMRLGLIGNAVIFGVHEPDYQFPLRVNDALGGTHWIDVLPRPKSALGYQGALGDTVKVNLRASELLGWDLQSDARWFQGSVRPFLFDIDLDYFAIPWSGYLIPWTDEIFEGEFMSRSEHTLTQGRSTRDFFLGLLDRAALLTISTEPKHCGDGDVEGPKVASILHRLNSYAFDGRMDLTEWLSKPTEPERGSGQ